MEVGRETLPSLAVAQKRHATGKKGGDPNQFTVSDKAMNLRNKQKRQIDYNGNYTKPWHMESLEAFYSFGFESFDNPPDGKNLFGG